MSAAAQAAIDEAIEGSFELPPSDSPDPEPGKNIWFVPLTSEVHDFRAPGSLYDAAEQMGWDLTQCDGKYSPDAITTCIRQAIGDGADGIFTFIVDCIFVKTALEDAEAKGIPVVGADGFDCNESKGGGPSLFDAELTYTNPADPDVPLTYATWIGGTWGRHQALAIINGTEGQAKLIDVFQTDAEFSLAQDEGVRAGLEELCPDCEIVDTVEFTGVDIGPPLQQKIAQALAQHPEANAILSPYDLVLTSVVGAVRESGRTGEMFVAGAEGQATTLDAIRDDKGVDAAVGLALDWELWGGLDALNRLFAGETPVETPSGAVGFPTGNSTQIVNADNNLPASGERYQPPLDFRDSYLKAWGVK